MNKFKTCLLMSLIVIASHSVAFGGTVSFDQLSVSDDLTATKYNSDLNTIYQKVNSNIQTDNILDDTLAEADMADEINPRIRTYEGASCEFVYTGLLASTTSGTLVGSIPAGTAYPRGYRIVKSSATPKTFTAQKWTWYDIDQNGDITYSEVAIGGATPAVASNSIRIAKVSTDTTQINTVTDLRTTSCTAGPFNIIADATGEADLGDIFTYGNGGWQNGLNLVSADATTFTIQPGAANINGEYRALTSALTVNSAVTASPSGGTSGIDAGSLAANTTYYVYGVADADGVTPLTGIMSTSSSAPSGATNYRRLGEITTELATASMVSSDAVSISYLGKVRQIKKFETGSYATGSTTIPVDATLPTSSEGDQYMSLTFTPTSATNILKIDVVVYANQTSGGALQVALFKENFTGAIGVGAQAVTNSDVTTNETGFTAYTQAGKASAITFTVRAGAASGNIHFNGLVTGVLYGKALKSSITITEYER